MEIFAYIAMASIATVLTRFLPFWLFKKKSKNPTLVYLQKNSGLVIMIVLMIYALKTMIPKFSENGENTTFFATICGLVFCLALSFLAHAKFRNSLITIAVPTLLYTIFLRFI
ncbi:AzlD domain-containing protein [Campylobacter sp. VBCF_06 NA8]|uniref:AzlD domain-containing protein n=1 Tax=unclassified Campylobacter TaxID=2593542 RepID=UPI0022E997BA|nr:MULTISPECIES: AzlD domain-containing protein [unclassified Campylobacter]MDA3046057.1 AzlD domain-containing protein [Campylobacter sp. VBCF_06 NA8]MDA3057803.1 AzlD domain-containing protein [Campylobacter sp. VBCF_04 NA7]MDA3058823.1 AzlD domain-containing protein [Campylobacter sp. VBCF_05 NA6]MDA3075885.1 AzlD domain-containing protein [Campylobacter sp. JMF_04 NA10]WBR54632.1 AzlD domain-containing protein [Campylobacter sp. VBCF_01 NA2]